MAASSRDRVTIDLRGIGDAVRASAAARGMSVACFSRQALIVTCDPGRAPQAPEPGRQWTTGRTKVTLRLQPPDLELLVLGATRLDLSYGDYVGHLLRGTPLPVPSADRGNDRAALHSSTDQLAELAVGLRDMVRLLRHGKSGEAQKYRSLLDTIGGEIARHIERASSFIANP